MIYQTGKKVAGMAMIWGLSLWVALGAQPARTVLTGHVPAITKRLAVKGSLPATNRLYLTIGLPLHNTAALDELIAQLYDPRSTNFHQFLTSAEFTARFGPTEQEYQQVIAFAETNGFQVAGTRSNRTVLDVEGGPAEVNRALGINLRTWQHPVENRDFFAPDTEPSVPAGLSISAIEGLSNYQLPRPLTRPQQRLTAQPLTGSGPGGLYAGNDFRNAYVPGTGLTGVGQKVGLLEFSGYYAVDITNYQKTIGLTNYVPLSNVVIGSAPSKSQNVEVALDIEMAIAMAPQLAQVIVYEESAINPGSILSRMASDNLAKQLSSSWAWSGGPSSTVDTALKQMITQGQSFFQASMDSDAYTGSQTLDNAAQSTAPVDSTNLTCVGGTTLSMNGAGTSRSSETVWNYNPYGTAYANVGSGGGISTYYTIPAWQGGINMSTNQGSSIWRNLPDVAMCGDNIYVADNNGTNSGQAGTSCSAPLWAGFTALVNQQAAAHSSTNSVGFLNPALYNLGTNASYTTYFHDINTGNNIGTNTAGFYYATNGYDLASGLGTPNGTNLINALAPAPGFLAGPAGLTATNGTSVTFTTTPLGAPPLAFQWRLAGTNLPGATAAALTLNPVGTNNVGSYTLVITNVYGASTSSAAALAVVLPPAITAQPVSLTVFAGSNAVFTVAASGNATLAYQWLKNGTNLANGTGIAGATTNVLTLTSVTTNSSGNYAVVITNLYGAATSSVAGLTVALPPAFTTTTITNRTLQCGSNVVSLAATVSGTAPLSYQWSLDAAPVSGATNASFVLTNLSLPNHTVGVTVTNLYASATSNAVLTVQDTVAPLVTLVGANPLYVELGNTFSDPGAVAYDTCAGAVAVIVSGTVNTNAVSTNSLAYRAGDGNGNTNTVTRTVIVRDTSAPVVLWSFTNLVLAAGTNCGALMPEVTGTNSILVSDAAGGLVITQSPTNQTFLTIGTNPVIITVVDPSGNVAYSTNRITVQDQSAPELVLQPQSRTNTIGSTAVFSVGAAACTPLAYQWYFNGNPLMAATNSTLSQSNLDLTLAGNYFAVASAGGGATTSSVATLTVVLPLAFTSTSVTNRTLECGSNTVTCSVTVSGTPPLSYQWSLDSIPVTAATNTIFTLTNLTLPSHTVGVTVTNLYASLTSNAVLTVQDTRPPLLSLVGSNLVVVDLGNAFTDPGAVAYDACAGTVAVSVSGSVNPSSLGTNTLVYRADDGNGNTNSITRTVLVQDTNLPSVLWSFTNLVLAANTNCGALMPDVTGTNSIIASNADGGLVISQNPTNQAFLVIGTNQVIITVADNAGSAVCSTNTIVVTDQSAPVLVIQPQSLTNTIGTTAVFSAAATACSPVEYQWFFNNAPLTTATNATLTESNVNLSLAGNYFAVATAAGGATTSAVVTLTVNLITATVTPAASANPAGFHGSVVFTAAVNPTSATGSIEFLANGTAFDTEPLLAGLATSTNITSLPRGTNWITVIYSGDAADLAATNVLAQIITNHPPVGATVAYSYSAGMVLTITLTNLSAEWSDVDGDPVSLADISQSTNGVTVTNIDGALTYANPNNVNDQFTCTITDGWGGTNYQTVNLTVVLPAISNITSHPDGSLMLQFTGSPGSTYVLEATGTLSPGNWQPVSTNTLDVTGTLNFSLTPDTNATQNFYRLRLAQ